jgi:methylenetetrahydrofolate dehydrogenase (NADP+)/methenyltetrahydrofolate cyclohydrolase
MSAIVFSGHELAARIVADARRRIDSAGAPRPTLALLVGAPSPAATSYRQRIASLCADAGIELREHVCPSSLDAVLPLLASLNAAPNVAGVLPLLPLPAGIDAETVASHVFADKDVDGLGVTNAGRLATGRAGIVPCTAKAAIRVAEALLGDLRGRTATVVGASIVVGRPLVEQLLRRGVTVTVAHVDTRDLGEACRRSELLFAAAGRPHLIGREDVAPGAVVVDIGVTEVVHPVTGAATLVGDVHPDAAARAAWITAPIEGVGPVTTACLVENVADAFVRLRGEASTRSPRVDRRN